MVVSGLLEREIDLSFQALQAGAHWLWWRKPLDRDDPGYATKQRHLVNTSGWRWHESRWCAAGSVLSEVSAAPVAEVETPKEASYVRVMPDVIAIGASAGGPSALSVLLNELPSHFFSAHFDRLAHAGGIHEWPGTLAG